MAKMIRCIEGHVFDAEAGRCPVCGWRVSLERSSLSDRLRRSIPTGAQIRQAFAAAAPPRPNASDGATQPGTSGRPAYSGAPFDAGALPPLSIQALPALLYSRSVWFIVAATVVIGLFIAQMPDDLDSTLNFIYLVAGFIVVVFVLGLRAFLRSTVPLVILLFAVGIEWVFMQVPLLPLVPISVYQDCELHVGHHGELFWYWAELWKYTISASQWGCPDSLIPGSIGNFLSYIVSVGIPEDTAKLVPVAILLLMAWGIRKAPPGLIAPQLKTTILRWSDIDRAGTIVMIAFAGAVGFVLYETLGEYLLRRINDSGPPIAGLVGAVGNAVSNAFPISLGDGTSLSKDQWHSIGLDIAEGYGLMKGFMLTIPRTIDLLTGHGAYAGVAAYYVALARRQSLVVGIGLIIFGLIVAAILHGAWDTFSTPTVEAPLGMLAAVVLLAVCVQAVAMDARAGFEDKSGALGRSMAFQGTIPNFPSGRGKGPQSGRVSVPAVGILVIEGSAGAPGRRVALRRDGARLELAPDVACEIKAHPSDPSRFGIKNLTARSWTLTMPDGRAAEVLPEKSAVLAQDAVIDFGAFRGRIEMA
jgi:RsiW-degrading membrane proteinase PrsW (M82 family)